MNTLTSLLSGGAIVAIISMASNFFLSNRKERVAYLREQIDKFYGPLFFRYLQKAVLQTLCDDAAKVTKEKNDRLDTALYDKWIKEHRGQLKELESWLDEMLRINISLIDIEDIDKFQSGIKGLKAICSYHDECEKKENDPSYELAIFTGNELLTMVRDAGNFFTPIKEKFYSKKNELIKINRGLGYFCQKVYRFLSCMFHVSWCKATKSFKSLFLPAKFQ